MTTETQLLVVQSTATPSEPVIIPVAESTGGQSGQQNDDAASPIGQAISRLITASIRADRAGFSQPKPETIQRAMKLFEALAWMAPAATASATVTIGPTGTANVVVSFGSKEADVTVPAEAAPFHVSVFDATTGDLTERQCDSSWAAADFVVQSV